ncbi:uncharacterized protein DSM5745_03128 [Aspergillus mulundensis]|uniref:glutamate decarboxylase n=1 Tax=Aspergillus mulundensis TaxID=1810919 RepID=A0A3D8SJL9_9EURO|nr:hypothetical protein DSM5745_03128 [Aspergillus mulundensis]RDW86486.1 hypothetical protein DSM5745_03128 [Aspergillus mulundensis]
MAPRPRDPACRTPLPEHRMNKSPSALQLEDEIPENETLPAYALGRIQNQLALDVGPARNHGSFVTTHMEPQAEQLMVETLSKNLINYESNPATSKIEKLCIKIIARLFYAPLQGSQDAVGTSTAGSSEAILLATLAMKKRWAGNARLPGNSAVQVCWKKAASYFDIEERYVYCTKDRNTIDPDEAIKLVDENTIGICSILGTTYTGEHEDTKAINDLLVARNLDVPIHLDAASGDFVAPFLHPELVWVSDLKKSRQLMYPVTSMGLSTRESGGPSGAMQNTGLESLYFITTISAQIRHSSISTSREVPPMSSGSTTISFV